MEALNKVEDAVGGKSEGKDTEDKKDTKEPKSDKEDKFPKAKDEKEEDKFPPEKDSEVGNEFKKDMPEDLEDEKDEVIKMAQELEPTKKLDPEMKGPEKGLGGPGGPGKGLGLGKGKEKVPFDITKLKKERDVEDGKKMNQDELGMESSPSGSSGPSVRVSITKDRNIVAYGPKGPLFLATPNANIKKDAEKLRRTANKVFAMVMYEGPKAAAAKCGTTLLAGVDDNITLDSTEQVPPVTQGITENGGTDTREDPENPPKTVLEDNVEDTQEKQDKITAIKARLAAKRASRKPARFQIVRNAQDTVLDDPIADNAEISEVSPGSLDTGKGGDTDTQEDIQPKPEDLLDGGTVDFKAVEANYKKLYASRLDKKVAEATEQFVQRLGRCLNIAAKRMVLNYDDDPMKIAAGDVLTSDNVKFASGESFVPMDEGTASELIELIASESHEEFVKHLMGRAADLMEKSDSYLKDAEADLQNLKPISPVTDKGSCSGPAPAKKAHGMRRAASAGNFELNTFSTPEPAPINTLREAIGLTLVGRKSANLKKLVENR
jgi:hypothetical protein